MIRFEALTLPAAIEVCRTMRARDAAALAAMLGPKLERDSFAVSRWQTDGAAWTMVDEYGPLAIGGLEFKSPWCGAMWFLAHARLDASPSTDQSWRKMLRQTRTVIANALDPANPHARQRVEAAVLSDWTAARSLVQVLGFEHEGTCRRAGSAGEDIEIWARVAEGK